MGWQLTTTEMPEAIDGSLDPKGDGAAESR